MKDSSRRALELISAVFICGLVHWLLRLPMSTSSLLWYDDGETLYHAASLAAGRIPYLEDSTHHFLGYILPFLALIKVFGLSLAIISKAALLNQALTGGLIFLGARIFFPFGPALLSGLTYVCAREPFTPGFYVQHQINLLASLIIFLCLRRTQGRSIWFLRLAFCAAGLAFIFDQRALALSFIPLTALFLGGGEGKLRRLPGLILAWALAPGAALYFLYSNGALPDLYHQTIVFPSRYRVGGLGLWEYLAASFSAHQNLILGAPVLCFLGAIGFGSLLTSRSSERRLLVLCFIPFAAMPLLGGRSYDYYSYTWLPYLSLLSVFGAAAAGASSARLGRAFLGALCLSALFSLGAAYRLSLAPEMRQDLDGAAETAAFAQARLNASDDIYLWGYRLDMYARLNKLAPTRLVGGLSIHPDPQISAPEKRLASIDPADQAEFLGFISNRPPKMIIVFSIPGISDKYSSPAEMALFAKLASDYSLAFTKTGRTPAGQQTIWRVYERRA